MFRLDAGDLVRVAGADFEMVVLGCADDESQVQEVDASWFCAWEAEHTLFAEIFHERELILVRKERRRVPRGGDINFPVRRRGRVQAFSLCG